MCFVALNRLAPAYQLAERKGQRVKENALRHALSP
jgi:hypothetical protein